MTTKRTTNDNATMASQEEKATGHTHGPWDIETVKDYMRTFDSGIDTGNTEALANARLIAAAPEMLEALKYANEIIQTAKRYFPKSIQNGDKFSLLNAGATITKAIAKAEGKN